VRQPWRATGGGRTGKVLSTGLAQVHLGCFLVRRTWALCGGAWPLTGSLKRGRGASRAHLVSYLSRAHLLNCASAQVEVLGDVADRFSAAVLGPLSNLARVPRANDLSTKPSNCSQSDYHRRESLGRDHSLTQRYASHYARLLLLQTGRAAEAPHNSPLRPMRRALA
jgi:hypothetical protein